MNIKESYYCNAEKRICLSIFIHFLILSPNYIHKMWKEKCNTFHLKRKPNTIFILVSFCLDFFFIYNLCHDEM